MNPNAPLTRVQAYAVLALTIVLIFGGLGVLLLWSLNREVEQPSMPPIVHGIETSWRSAQGAERVWSINGPGDYRPWLAEHVALVTEAQRLLPPEGK